MSATANPHPFRNSKDPYGPRSDAGVDIGGREKEREEYIGRRNRNSHNVKKNGADNNYNNSFINRFNNDDNKKENKVRRNSSQSVSVPFLSGSDEKMTNSIGVERDQERDRRNDRNSNSNRDGEDRIKDEGGKGSERGRGDIDWDTAPLPDNWERRLDKESAKVRLLNGLLLLYYCVECTTTLLSSCTVFTSCSDLN